MTDTTTASADRTRIRKGSEDAAQAAADVIRQDQAALARRLRERKQRLERATASATRARDALTRDVALTVSAKPEAPDWWAHPGALSRQAVQDATGLTTMGLHRLMERYRGSRQKKGARKT